MFPFKVVFINCNKDVDLWYCWFMILIHHLWLWSTGASSSTVVCTRNFLHPRKLTASWNPKKGWWFGSIFPTFVTRWYFQVNLLLFVSPGGTWGLKDLSYLAVSQNCGPLKNRCFPYRNSQLFQMHLEGHQFWDIPMYCVLCVSYSYMYVCFFVRMCSYQNLEDISMIYAGFMKEAPGFQCPPMKHSVVQS